VGLKTPRRKKYTCYEISQEEEEEEEEFYLEICNEYFLPSPSLLILIIIFSFKSIL
jgi:hypothetical protein